MIRLGQKFWRGASWGHTKILSIESAVQMDFSQNFIFCLEFAILKLQLQTNFSIWGVHIASTFFEFLLVSEICYSKIKKTLQNNDLYEKSFCTAVSMLKIFHMASTSPLQNHWPILMNYTLYNTANNKPWWPGLSQLEQLCLRCNSSQNFVVLKLGLPLWN